MAKLTILDKLERDLPEVKQTDIIKVLTWLGYTPDDIFDPDPPYIEVFLKCYWMPRAVTEHMKEYYVKPPQDPNDWE